ncbi:MAG: TIGR00341 family protein [Candidatus Bathyarchaeota archaeon]|nr:TIGR00341 family protein [Candidatus Bathyarchaeum tardum]WGM89181.1 MAG: TIGR00341 family protein [Candidatus Bathyarchaeum tardum]WNZ28579.1 MAG: TIGR00341 family protein [Candidatus Bathyarchaeota archaeon]
MKKLEVNVTTNEARKVKQLLTNLELSYVCSSMKIENEKFKTFSCLVPDQLIDRAIEEISEIMDLRLTQNSISVYNVEAYVSSHLDRIKEKIGEENPPPNPFERLLETTEKFTQINKDLIIMALFATIIALAGLFLDNPVTVIGAMLLSPLLGPINAFAVNASIGKIKKLVKTEASIIILLGSVILLSALTTIVVSFFVDLQVTSQISIRSQTSLTDVGIGLILGLAGGLALVAAIPEILVGVGVASALLPPATVSGIGLALMNGNMFFGALTVTMVYLVGLELGCTVMLRIKGLQPRRFYQKADAKKRSAYFIITLSILLIILMIVIYRTG